MTVKHPDSVEDFLALALANGRDGFAAIILKKAGTASDVAAFTDEVADLMEIHDCAGTARMMIEEGREMMADGYAKLAVEQGRCPHPAYRHESDGHETVTTCVVCGK